MPRQRKTLTPSFRAFALALASLALSSTALAQIPQPPLVPMRTNIPNYYSAVGPKITVGPFSEALESAQTLDDMRRVESELRASWDTLPFEVMYVAAIRFFDFGSRRDAVYWFYSAQFRARLVLAGTSGRDQRKRGEPAWQLRYDYEFFHEFVGRYVNGIAYCDLDELFSILDSVRRDATVPDVGRIYPNLGANPSKVRRNFDDVSDGLGDYAKKLDRRRAEIRRARTANGMDRIFCGPDALVPGPPIEPRRAPVVELPPPVEDDTIPDLMATEPLEGSPLDVRVQHGNPGWSVSFDAPKPLAEIRYRTSFENDEKLADPYVIIPNQSKPFDVFVSYRIDEGDPLLGPFRVHVDPQERLIQQLRGWLLQPYIRDEWVRVTHLGTQKAITKTELHFGWLVHARCAIESVVYGIDTMDPDIPFYLEPCDLLAPTYNRGRTVARHSGKATYVSVQIKYRDGTVSKVRWY